MRTHSNVNDFDLHENGRASGKHFHMNGFAPRLVLKQRQRGTRKWPVAKHSTRFVPVSPAYEVVTSGH